jgi:hypothetical protein
MDDVMMASAADYESDNDSLVATKRHRVKQTWMDDEAEDDDDEDDEFKGNGLIKPEINSRIDTRIRRQSIKFI